jgi:GTP-binding protein YchF
MNIKAGLVGLPNVGKSTLFNTLTNNNIPAENYPFCTKDPHTAKTEIYDPRIAELHKIYKSEKIVYPFIEFVDIAGLVRGASQGAGLGNQFLANIREVSTIIHVLRCFEDIDIINTEQGVNPIRDFEIIMFEFAQKDLETIQHRLSKIDTIIKKAPAKEKELYTQEKSYLESLVTIINNMNFMNNRSVFSNEQVKHLNLLLAKKSLVVANIGESDISDTKNNKYIQELQAYFGEENIIPLCIRFENEIQKLDAEDKKVFLEEYGLKETSINRIIAKTYRQLELISFFTCGPKEIHTWTIQTNTNIKDAAGEIHSDLSRGFISAEVIPYSEIIAYKSELGVKNAGKMKVVGNTYIVNDGDIININFNV